MPPEQLRGEHATAAWDVWALALIAYEMLTGKLPFRGHVGGAAVVGREAAITASLDGPLVASRATFVRALSLDPDGRFGSASELFEALQQTLQENTIASATSWESEP
jgi:serine/threonine-protein kinase